jgi:hypothetical protein
MHVLVNLQEKRVLVCPLHIYFFVQFCEVANLIQSSDSRFGYSVWVLCWFSFKFYLFSIRLICSKYLPRFCLLKLPSFDIFPLIFKFLEVFFPLLIIVLLIALRLSGLSTKGISFRFSIEARVHKLLLCFHFAQVRRSRWRMRRLKFYFLRKGL